MKNVIILGASGNLATHVIKILAEAAEVNLTLFLRRRSRLQVKETAQYHIIEGDVLNFVNVKL